MSTTKTIKIQKNKILTYSINKSGFQTVNKSIVVTEDMTINENMISQSGSPILQLGDRLFGISSFVCYFTPSGTYDVDSLKFMTAKQTTGTGLTNIQVVKELWLAQIETALSVETPKGTSKSFVFTYNGSTWDLTGAVTVSGISQTDLGDVYGISFTGIATTGDVITVIETQYNKFAVYVLDANYRSIQGWGNAGTLIMPKQYTSDPQNCIESATYYNQYIFNNANLNNYPAFNHCKSKGNFILNENIKINCIIPNGYELQQIYNNRVILDSFDPIIQGGSTDYNLTNWVFPFYQRVWSCIEYNNNSSWSLLSNDIWNSTEYGKETNLGIVPVFEVPVM